MTTTPSSRSTLLVLGAGGRLGREIVSTALGRGHRVRAVVHHNNPFTAAGDLEVAHADVRVPETLDQLWTDVSAVIASLGSAQAETPDIASAGAATIVDHMVAHDVQRLVTVTGSAVVLPGEKPTLWHAAKRAGMLLGAPSLVADGDRHLALVAASDRDWTTLRVPLLTRQRSLTYTVTPTAPHPSSTLPYLAAATAVLDAVESNQWLRSAPFAAA